MKELAWHLFTWGDQIQILQPDALKTAMWEELNIALACHGQGPTSESGAGEV